MSQGPVAADRPLQSKSEGEELVTHLVEVMDTLLGTVEEETRLVREGKLRAASLLAQPKADLSQHYIADVTRLKANQAFLKQTMPTVLENLKQRHDQFRALLQINLTVLATAHFVSEGIVRGVAGELARKSAPSTYGATGLANVPGPRAAQPLAVSRSL
jgi:hypothetical protein